MQNKIAFEEHVAIPETLEQARPYAGDSGQWEDFARRLLDTEAERLDGMAANGIDYAILSLHAPGIQAILDPRAAVELAARANDRLAEATVRHPHRYGAFAALPMQDPEAAAAELVRRVRGEGFKGAMLNGFTQKVEPETAIYYDDPQFAEFWATVAELGVPVYLHPRMQIPSRAQNYDGHRWMMSAPWGFAVETSIHALRLCGSGLFETHPGLRLILGHLGENIPYGLERMNARMRFAPRGYEGRRLPGEYFRDHFHVTTSGNFSDPAFRCALEVMGTDRLHFSADYPFEDMEDGASWFDGSAVLDEATRRRVGRDNAMALFNLDPGALASPSCSDASIAGE